MENRTTYIDASLLVSPSSFLTDERVREFQRKNYTNVRLSMKSRSKLFANIRELLAKRRHRKIEPLLYKHNSLLIAWLNYFSISKVTHIWETIKVIIKHLIINYLNGSKAKNVKHTSRFASDHTVLLYKAKDCLT